MSPQPHAITALTLQHFRNYRELALTVPPAPVVLRGSNGAGKTNILEAISLLSPGRGLRSATLRTMDRMDASNPGQPALPWVVAANLVTRGEPHFIGTGRDGDARTEKRIIKINGEKVRSHAELANHTCIQWLTPSMDQVFTAGGSARRAFFDRLVYGFSPEHATRVSTYERTMRERNRLLGEPHRADPHWLSVLERQMAEQAVAITLARQEMLARLHGESADYLDHFPQADLRLEGTIEQLLQAGNAALDAEEAFADLLAKSRPVDAARGRAQHGPHRSSWMVQHQPKQMLAEQCSTGEQKALLLAIVLAAARARAAWCGTPPILLLDEVIAHLDADKRASLFELIRATQIQAWMTGTDAADFKGIESFATILEVQGGTMR